MKQVTTAIDNYIHPKDADAKKMIAFMASNNMAGEVRTIIEPNSFISKRVYVLWQDGTETDSHNSLEDMINALIEVKFYQI